MGQKRGLKPTIFSIKNRKDAKSMLSLSRNRRGQFYLITALIIISVIVGYAGISNYLEKKETLKLYDLGEELGIESENVLDYGTYNELNESEMNDLINSFIDSYVEYIEEGIEIYFIFGNWESITVVKYQEVNYYSAVVEGGVSSSYIETETFTPEEKEVMVTINGINYTFKLKPGENFYFVISQEVGEEQHVVIG